MSQPELLYVEQPAVDQLQSNGWSYKDGRELAQNDSEVKELEVMMHEFLKELEYE